MTSAWIVGVDPSSENEQGYIIHRHAPEFIAKWAIEDDAIGTLSDRVYTDATERDAVAIYDFEWRDEEPSEEIFRKMGANAVDQVDEYLLIVSG